MIAVIAGPRLTRRADATVTKGESIDFRLEASIPFMDEQSQAECRALLAREEAMSQAERARLHAALF